MKILCCIKQVPDTGSVIKLNSCRTGIAACDMEYVINPFDEYALEAALLLKDLDKSHHVTAVTAGPPRCRQALVSALTVGADRAIFVTTKEDRGYDSLFNANLVGKAISQAGFDVLLCGMQGADYNNGLFPVYLAKKLNLPVLTNIFSIDMAQEFQSLRAVRLNVDGSQTVFSVKLPAVLSFTRGKTPLRYASLPEIVKARKKEIVLVAPEEDAVANLGESMQLRELQCFEPKRDQVVVNDTDGTAANRLFNFLVHDLKAFD